MAEEEEADRETDKDKHDPSFISSLCLFDQLTFLFSDVKSASVES